MYKKTCPTQILIKALVIITTTNKKTIKALVIITTTNIKTTKALVITPISLLPMLL